MVVAVASGSATALTLQSFTVDPLRVSMADTTDLDDVHVESRSLDFSGGDIVGVSTAINNTKVTDLSVDVIVQLEELDGTVVERETKTVLLGSVSVTLVDITLSQSHPPRAFAAVNVTVTQSL